MKPCLRLFAAILAGLLLGGILALGSWLLPPPPGVNLQDMAGLQAALPTLPPVYLLPPWPASCRRHPGRQLAGQPPAAGRPVG